ncbi:EexN family lipoprotein [Campylobacter upsaliensis]|uniref:EexN family lipoprotein n=1 Tax=Campylobacter upsaliensis TaxID=28080 RepID=UPI002B3C383C|nr:EexN family lipoprotein [Campylobacter upsaliensis]MEB2817509.1 EexN family lipoprotein [Campylobacter upsaliensis]
MKNFFLLTTSLFFVACEQTRSLEFYEQNPQIARERSLECREKSIISQDCVNAHKVGFPKSKKGSASKKSGIKG